MTDELREELAAYAHDAWARRTQRLHGRSVKNAGNLIVPRWLVEQHTRQMRTPYADLPEGEKDSDRAEADRMLIIIENARGGKGATQSHTGKAKGSQPEVEQGR